MLKETGVNNTAQERLTDLYINNVDRISEGMPLWFNSRRREYLELFKLAGLPDKSDEKYRLCDMQRLFDRELNLCVGGSCMSSESRVCSCPMGNSVSMSQPHNLPEIDAYRIELLNGFVRDGVLEVLGNGIIYGSLRTAAIDFEELVIESYGQVANVNEDSMVALNSIFVQDGVFIYIPKGVKVDKPFVIIHDYADCRTDSAICFGRELIVAQDNAQAQVMVVHNVNAGSQAIVSFVREVAVSDGANVHIAEYANCNAENKSLLCTYIDQGVNSRVKSVMVELGGDLTRVDSTINLKGRGAEAEMYSLYLNNGTEQSDINVDMNHIVSDCRSSQSVKGVVSGEARGAFMGRVYVAPGAQRTQAFQKSMNLELSDQATINVKPQLEIYADDVKCSHGATVGQLDSEALFYMRQRGLSEESARRLQLLGFVNDIILHFPTEELARYIFEVTQSKINQM